MTMEVSLLAAIIAGIVSFLSPCVLPVVPAYLGQLGVVMVRTPEELAAGAPAEGGAWGRSRGWRALPGAFAFVAGFTVIFTLAGLALSAAVDPFQAYRGLLQTLAGILLVLLGLNLMGVLRPAALMRTWRPLADRRPDGFGAAPRRRPGVTGGLILGATFAVGWSPCIGPTLGAILGMSVQYGPGPEVAALLIAYSLGLGVPFLLLALAVDRAPAITRPLVRHGRTIEIVGGALVVLIGLAIAFDVLGMIARLFSGFIPQV